MKIYSQVHTPDSSRYWINESYEAHFKEGLEPENIDKVKSFIIIPHILSKDLTALCHFY